MNAHLRGLATLLALVPLLVSCAGGPSGPDSGTNSIGSGTTAAEVRPHIRSVAAADHALLWTAARDYMQKAFPVDTLSEERKVVESHLLEWEENNMPHRTRVTVEVRRDATDPRNAQVGIVAQLIEPQYDFDNLRTGRPAWKGWILMGNNEKIAQIVGDQILRRYFLLRHGRDPDNTPQDDPFRRFQKSTGNTQAGA